MAKEIYGAIEIADKEIRLIIGEYYNTRFNIIRVEKEAHNAVKEFSITNKEEIKTCILTLIERANKLIGANIQRLLLLIPSVNFKRYPLKVAIRTATGVVHKSDVTKAIKKAMRTDVDRNILIVNAVCVKYTCNGITSRRLPDREVADEVIVDIDLLCADKTITFDYVSILEECGIEVMDISLDMYSICKEAALFEQTVNQNVILLRIDYDATTLALISKGKLVNCDILYEGLNKVLNTMYNTYRLPFGVNDRLVKYNTSFTSTEQSKTSIFAWKTSDGLSHSINELELANTVKADFDDLVSKIKEACDPILESGKTSIVVVGEGAKIKALNDLLAKVTKVSVKTYAPETIGVRDSAYTALLGAIYGYRDLNQINEKIESSIDLYQLSQLIDKKITDTEGETLTTRIKNLFDSKKREDKE